MDRRLLLQLLATGGALTAAPGSVWAAGQTPRGMTGHPMPGDKGSLPLSTRESLPGVWFASSEDVARHCLALPSEAFACNEE